MYQCKHCDNTAAVVEWDWDCGWVFVCFDHIFRTHQDDYFPTDDDRVLAQLIDDDATNYVI